MNKFLHFWVFSEDLGVMILMSQLCFGKKCMNLLMANAVQILGSFSTFGFGDEVMGILL